MPGPAKRFSRSRSAEPRGATRMEIGDLTDANVARQVAQADFLFLCTDSISSRLVANAIAHAYLLPAIQIGAKIDLVQGAIESVYVAVRPVLPDSGCLACAGLIDPTALQYEAASPEERRAQNYLALPDVVDPSVVTLNGVAASMATNAMLMWAVGLGSNKLMRHRLLDARTGDWLALRPSRDPNCPWCARGPRGAYALGDHAVLPVQIRPIPSGRPRSGRSRIRRLGRALQRR